MSLTTINILLNNARLHIQSGELDKGEELLFKAQALDGENPDVLRLLSVVAAMRFNYLRALELINRVISLAPKNAIAYSNRGNILKELYRLDEALISLDKAIELQPDYAEAYNNKGNVLQDLHRYEEALQWYDKAIALQQNYAEAYSNKGNALELLHRHDEAMEQQQYWWSPAGVQHQGRNDVAFEEEVGETVTPDMAADAAMLREQLRVETNVRLSLAEKQDAQKPFFTEEPKLYMMKDIETHVDRIVHLEYYENLNVVPTATGWADAITGEPLIRSL